MVVQIRKIKPFSVYVPPSPFLFYFSDSVGSLAHRIKTFKIKMIKEDLNTKLRNYG